MGIIGSCLDCGGKCAWYTEEIDGEEYSVAFHNGEDKTLCLQAGYSGGDLRDGTKIRLMDCDSGERLQYFIWQDYEAPIKIAEDSDLCMVSQGVPDVLGARMIVKDCDERNWEWSGDELD